MIDSLTDLDGEVVTVVNSTFHETVIYIKDVKSYDDGYYSECIFANVSDGAWGTGTIDDGFVSMWGGDMDFADKKYQQWMLETIFEGEVDNWILERG